MLCMADSLFLSFCHYYVLTLGSKYQGSLSLLGPLLTIWCSCCSLHCQICTFYRVRPVSRRLALRVFPYTKLLLCQRWRSELKQNKRSVTGLHIQCFAGTVTQDPLQTAGFKTIWIGMRWLVGVTDIALKTVNSYPINNLTEAEFSLGILNLIGTCRVRTSYS